MNNYSSLQSVGKQKPKSNLHFLSRILNDFSFKMYLILNLNTHQHLLFLHPFSGTACWEYGKHDRHGPVLAELILYKKHAVYYLAWGTAKAALFPY